MHISKCFLNLRQKASSASVREKVSKGQSGVSRNERKFEEQEQGLVFRNHEDLSLGNRIYSILKNLNIRKIL